MDPQNPLRTIASPVKADVLGVLVATQQRLTGATIDRLAGRSHAQVRDVLRRLAASGLVEAERVGNAVLYRLNREHLLAPAVVGIAGATRALEGRLRELAHTLRPAPSSVALFGSFALGDGDAESDVDILVVRPERIDVETEGWSDVRLRIAQHVEHWTGNRCHIVEVSPQELHEGAQRGEPLVDSLRRDARDVFGIRIHTLID